MGGKVQDIKAREKEGKGRTASPANSPARYPALPPTWRSSSLGRTPRARPERSELGWREGPGSRSPQGGGAEAAKGSEGEWFPDEGGQACSAVTLEGPPYRKSPVPAGTDHTGLLWRGRPDPAGLSATHRGVPSPKRMPSGRGGRDRFTAESYTVLGKDGRKRDVARGAWAGRRDIALCGRRAADGKTSLWDGSPGNRCSGPGTGAGAAGGARGDVREHRGAAESWGHSWGLRSSWVEWLPWSTWGCGEAEAKWGLGM